MRDVQLGDLLGRGNNGEVYRAAWGGRAVAVKVVRLRKQGDLDMFNQEVLAHTHAAKAGVSPPIFDSWVDAAAGGEASPRGVILMGLVDGTLEGLLRDEHARARAAATSARNRQRLASEAVAGFAARAVGGLQDLLGATRRVGLQHNDASTANVGYVGPAEAPRWLFIDWGMGQLFHGGEAVLEMPPHLRSHPRHDPEYDAALLSWSLAWWFDRAEAWPAPCLVDRAALARYLRDTAPRHRWQGLTDRTGLSIERRSRVLWQRLSQPPAPQRRPSPGGRQFRSC